MGNNVQLVTMWDEGPINVLLDPIHEYTANKWSTCVAHYTQKADGTLAMSVYDAQKNTDFTFDITGLTAWIQ